MVLEHAIGVTTHSFCALGPAALSTAWGAALTSRKASDKRIGLCATMTNRPLPVLEYASPTAFVPHTCRSTSAYIQPNVCAGGGALPCWTCRVRRVLKDQCLLYCEKKEN